MGSTEQDGDLPPAPSAVAPDAALIGRDFITSVVVFHEAVAARLGLSATDRKCLDLISRGPVTAGQLAAFTGLTSGAVTGIIDRLVAAGYAERAVDLDDRRRVLVSRRAHSALDTILSGVFGPLGADMQELSAGYTPDELTAIADFLARTREILVHHTSRVARPD